MPSSYSPYSVAEFAWALALTVDRRIVRAAHRTREFDFRLDGLMGRDLHGRTAGVVGTGKIGTAFARIAHAFGMRLLGWDVAENPDCLATRRWPTSRTTSPAEAVTTRSSGRPRRPEAPAICEPQDPLLRHSVSGTPGRSQEADTGISRPDAG